MLLRNLFKNSQDEESKNSIKIYNDSEIESIVKRVVSNNSSEEASEIGLNFELENDLSFDSLDKAYLVEELERAFKTRLGETKSGKKAEEYLHINSSVDVSSLIKIFKDDLQKKALYKADEPKIDNDHIHS